MAGAGKALDYFRFRPRRLIVEPTNRCNMACSVCFRSPPTDSLRPEGLLSPALFDEILTKCGDTVDQISLYFRGEPLLHPGLAGLVERCRDRGIGAQISTNGWLLDAGTSERLVRAGLDAITVNYDAIADGDYGVIRGPGAPGGILDRLLGLQAVKRALGSTTPAISVKALNRGHAPSVIAAFLTRLEATGLEAEVQIGDCFPWPGRAPHPAFPHALWSSPRMCCMYYQPVTITWDGVVVPCSYDVREEFTLGRIGDWATVADIYRSAAHRAFRRRILFKRFKESRPCAGCLLPLLGLEEGRHRINAGEKQAVHA